MAPRSSSLTASRLAANDRYDEAKAVFTKYHANGDPNHPIVELQMKEIMYVINSQPPATWKDLFDLKVLVDTRSSRYRLMLNVAFSWFGQFSGNK